MFAQLKPVVDLLSTGATHVSSVNTRLQRRKAVLRMLEAYFLLKDCMDEGMALVAEAGPNPVLTISAMSDEDAIATGERWNLVLRKQAVRLNMLQDRIFAQDHLSIIAPEVQAAIDKAVGSKFDRVTTLARIGAGLVLQAMFGFAKTPQERAGHVIAMTGAKKDKINMRKIKKEVAALSTSLDAYRGVIEKLVSTEEIVRLSKQARKATRFQSPGVKPKSVSREGRGLAVKGLQ